MIPSLMVGDADLYLVRRTHIRLIRSHSDLEGQIVPGVTFHPHFKHDLRLLVIRIHAGNKIGKQVFGGMIEI